MKKQLFTAICLSVALVSSSAFADTATKSFGGFSIQVNTPSASTSTSSTTANSAINQAAMKAQINKLYNTTTSVSANYQTAVNGLVNSILPADISSELNAEKAKIQNSVKNPLTVKIDVAENGAVTLTKYLSTKDAVDTLKNMPANKLAAAQANVNKLKSVTNSYQAIAADSKTLAKQIKVDPVAALALRSDLSKLVSVQKEIPTQIKTIANLTKAIVKTSSKAGVNIK